MGKRIKFIVLIAAAILICYCTVYNKYTSNNKVDASSMKMFRIKEPLQILGEEDDGCYVLPIGTVLYYDKSFAEGFSQYWVPLNHKGKIEWEEVHLEPKHQGRLIIPLWLENIDEARLKDISRHFPLTKSDVKAAVEAKQITKDDLADIVRSMSE